MDKLYNRCRELPGGLILENQTNQPNKQKTIAHCCFMHLSKCAWKMVKDTCFGGELLVPCG
jgi:hypothetical protein